MTSVLARRITVKLGAAMDGDDRLIYRYVDLSEHGTFLGTRSRKGGERLYEALKLSAVQIATAEVAKASGAVGSLDGEDGEAGGISLLERYRATLCYADMDGDTVLIADGGDLKRACEMYVNSNSNGDGMKSRNSGSSGRAVIKIIGNVVPRRSPGASDGKPPKSQQCRGVTSGDLVRPSGTVEGSSNAASAPPRLPKVQQQQQQQQLTPPSEHLRALLESIARAVGPAVGSLREVIAAAVQADEGDFLLPPPEAAATSAPPAEEKSNRTVATQGGSPSTAVAEAATQTPSPFNQAEASGAAPVPPFAAAAGIRSSSSDSDDDDLAWPLPLFPSGGQNSDSDSDSDTPLPVHLGRQQSDSNSSSSSSSSSGGVLFANEDGAVSFGRSGGGGGVPSADLCSSPSPAGAVFESAAEPAVDPLAPLLPADNNATNDEAPGPAFEEEWQPFDERDGGAKTGGDAAAAATEDGEKGTEEEVEAAEKDETGSWDDVIASFDDHKYYML